MKHRIFEITSKLKAILNNIQVKDVKKMTIKLETSQSNATNAIKPEAEKFEKIVYSSFATCSMIDLETKSQTKRNAHITSEQNAQNPTIRDLETKSQMKRNADTI